MKTRVIINTLPEALCHMKESFHAIKELWDSSPSAKEILDSSVDIYPFSMDYDSLILEVDKWIDHIYSQIEMKKAYVEMLAVLTNHEVDEKYYPLAIKELADKFNLSITKKE